MFFVQKRAPSGKAIDKIEFEFFAIRIDVQLIEIGAQVVAQDVELCLAVRLDRRRRFVRMPLEKNVLTSPLEVNGHGIMLDTF